MSAPSNQAETVLSRHWRKIAKLALSGDIDEALPAILRAPDRLAGLRTTPDVDYRLLASYLRGLTLDDPVEVAVAGLLEAHCLYRAGDTMPARERFLRGADEASLIEEPHRALSLSSMAHCGEALASMRGGDLPAAIELGRKAVREARGVDCDWLRAYAQHTLGRVLGVEPRHRARARSLLQQAADTYRSPGVKDLRGEAYVLHILGRLEADAGETERALNSLQRGLSIMRRSRAQRGTATLMIDVGWLRCYQQAYSLARGYGRKAMEILDVCNDHRGLAKVCHLIGWTYLREGALAEAQAEFARALEYAETTVCPNIKCASHYYLARSAFEAGDNSGTGKWLRRAQTQCECDPLLGAPVSALVCAREIRGRQWRKAGQLLRRLQGDLRSLGVSRLEADGLFLCGFELCRQGRQEQAAPLLQQAMQVADTGQASSAMQAFLAGAGGTGLEHWLSTVVAASERSSQLAQELVDQTQGAIFTLHNLKNMAGSVLSYLDLHELEPEEFPLEPDAIRAQAQDAADLATRLWIAFRDGEDVMQPELSPFDLGAFARDQVKIGNTWPAGGLEYVADVEDDMPLVMADKNLMTQVVGNLKSNAEKYAPNATVTMSAKTVRDKEGRPVAGVLGFADTGPGIHPDDVELLFIIGKDPSDYATRGVKHGWGVGLGFCRVAVESMGGRIWVESELGDGATFYVELPLAPDTG